MLHKGFHTLIQRNLREGKPNMDFLSLRSRTFIRVNWFQGLLTILYIQRGIHFASSNLHFLVNAKKEVDNNVFTS